MKAFWKQFYRDNFEVFEERDYAWQNPFAYNVFKGRKRRKLIRTSFMISGNWE